MTCRRWRVALCAVLGIWLASGVSAGVHAAEKLVTAEFAPSALDPTRNVFRNTTPPGVYCSWRPEFCSSDGAYTVDVPLSWSKVYLRDGAVRERFYLGLPPQRKVTLTHLPSGAITDVALSIEAVSGQLTPGGSRNPVFTRYVGGGCQYVKTSDTGPWVRFGWIVRNPLAPTPCNSRGDGSAPDPLTFNMSWFGLGLRITSDSPLTLLDGIYEGETTYTAGGLGSDIDFGDDVTTEPITLKFRFTVKHDFQARFATDAATVQLAPEGGWLQWSAYGKPPPRLRQDLPFHLTSSMDFSMKLRCEFEAEGRCGIRHVSENQTVPVEVDVTLPGMRVVNQGGPAQRVPLVMDDARAPRFAPQGYVIQQPSTVRFSAEAAAVKEMVKWPGSHWRGNITLMFDANP